MSRKFVDALAFAGLVVVGCIWSVTAFGQAPSPPGNTSLLNIASASASGTTGAVTATTPFFQGRLTYICGFTVSAAGSATISPITLGGVQSGPFVYQGISAGGVPFTQTFAPCLPASAPSSQITVTTTADATATAVNVNIWGYWYPVP